MSECLNLASRDSFRTYFSGGEISAWGVSGSLIGQQEDVNPSAGAQRPLLPPRKGHHPRSSVRKEHLPFYPSPSLPLDYAPTDHNLHYCAQEIGKMLRPETLCSNSTKTKEGDVFSFGTLIYLIFIGKLPYKDLDVPELLSRVRAGDFPSLLRGLNSNLASIIRWIKTNQFHLDSVFLPSPWQTNIKLHFILVSI